MFEYCKHALAALVKAILSCVPCAALGDVYPVVSGAAQWRDAYLRHGPHFPSRCDRLPSGSQYSNARNQIVMLADTGMLIIGGGCDAACLNTLGAH